MEIGHILVGAIGGKLTIHRVREIPSPRTLLNFKMAATRRQSWRETSNHASTLHKAASNHSSTRMASLACSNHRLFCAQQCSWIPTLLLLTIAASAVRLAQIPHYRSDNNGSVELSPTCLRYPPLHWQPKDLLWASTSYQLTTVLGPHYV